MSYIFVKSTVSSIFRSRWFSSTRSSMQIISLWLLSFCSLFSILSPFFIIPYLHKKAQLLLDFFDRLSRRS